MKIAIVWVLWIYPALGQGTATWHEYPTKEECVRHYNEYLADKDYSPEEEVVVECFQSNAQKT